MAIAGRGRREVAPPALEFPKKPPPPFGNCVTCNRTVIAPAAMSVISARYRPESLSAGSPIKITGALGILIGLPALRLSGLYLALITLMAAGAITVLLQVTQFPNGGGGFFGNSSAGGATSRLPRPAIAMGDTACYRYCVVVAGL